VILVLGGTKEAGEIIQVLSAQGYKLLATAISAYGGELAKASGATEIWVGSLDDRSLAELITKKKIKAVIDATHPYATAITQLASEVCAATGIKYFRHARPSSKLDSEPGSLYWVDSYAAGAELAFKLGNVVMTTTGSKNLAPFVSAKGPEQRLVVRVLPESSSIAECRKLGCQPRDIVALQGPFSVTLNKALFQEYGVEVIVTKESGTTGGVDTKLKAALEMQLPVVIIRRPQEPVNKIWSTAEILKVLKEEATWRLE